KLTFAQVRVEAQRKLGQAADGRDFAAERKAHRAIPTLSAFLEDTYGPWVKQNRRSGSATLNRLEACFADGFGKVKLFEITPAKLETWRADRRRDGVTAETINRDIS